MKQGSSKTEYENGQCSKVGDYRGQMLGKRKRTSSATCGDKRELTRGRKRRSGKRAKNMMAAVGL